MKKLFIKTYGCQMNLYDSEKISNILQDVGYSTTDNYSEADLILLNTCHIRDKAVEKTYSDLGRIKKVVLKNKIKNLKPVVIVAGCVAQAQGREILKRSPWVDIVVGPQSYADLPKLVSKAAIHKQKYINLEFPVIPKFDLINNKNGKRNVSPFLTIQEGCDKFCSFCVVPYTRGPEYSRPVNSIIEELKILIEKGAKEVTLLGQNVNAWNGHSKNGSKWSFGRLLEEISKFDQILSIKYTTSHPLDVDQDLLNAHKNLSKLMPYLHLPVQSGSNRILKIMNRKHSVEDYIEIINKVRQHNPNIAISSDFIVGYPGENELDHKKTLELINEIKFSSSFSFKYSPRPGTPSFKLNDNISIEEKKARLKEIQQVLNHHHHEFNKKFLGSRMKILIANKNKKNSLFGRSPYNQIVTLLDNENKLGENNGLINNFVDVRITRANQNSLEAKLD